VSVCAVLVVSFLASGAIADPTPADRALATELFKQGRALLEEGKTADACRKLEESQRLDPGGGTLLNLAICHEAEGKMASAWSELNEAIGIAQRDGRRDRADLAQQHLQAVEPKLSRLTIVVPPEADTPDMKVARDGTNVARVAWGSAIPVDPGSHRIEVSAPGKVAWSGTVDVGADADKKTITVPVLEAAPAVAPPAPALPPATAAPARAAAPSDSGSDSSPPSLLPGLIIGGVGVAALGVGTYFGAKAISKKNESDEHCNPICDTPGSEASFDAGQAADIATVSLIVGAVGVGVGTFFVVRSLRARKPGVTASVGLGSLQLRGAW
jgi:hypothetical protein